MSKAQEARDEQARCVAQLREWLKPGDTVYTIIRNVSRSGMSRQIGCVILSTNEDGSTTDTHPNYMIGKACGYTMNKSGDGLKVSGCGMDMGFSVVYDLSRVLFPDGFKCINGRGGRGADRCPSNDHSNAGSRDNKQHSDGGYALRQRWL